MKFVVLGWLIFFSAVALVSAQTNEKEAINLRRQIKIPARDTIRSDKDFALPANDSLKIFLMIKRTGSEADGFEKWVAKWNEEDGEKFGKLTIVKDVLKADVVLMQFVSNSIERAEEASISVGNIPSNEQIVSPKPKFKVNADANYKSLPLPVYSYLIVRDGDIWTIVYRDVEGSLPGDQIFNPELRLWRRFKEEMKSR